MVGLGIALSACAAPPARILAGPVPEQAKKTGWEDCPQRNQTTEAKEARAELELRYRALDSSLDWPMRQVSKNLCASVFLSTSWVQNLCVLIDYIETNERNDRKTLQARLKKRHGTDLQHHEYVLLKYKRE